MFKVSAIFYIVAYVIVLVAAVLLWTLAYTTGTVDNVEGFIRDLFGLKTFKFDGQKIFEASWLLGAFLAIAGTGLAVTLAVLFNLISDLVGGIRITVLEEEVILRERPARPLPAPQPAAGDRPDGVRRARHDEQRRDRVDERRDRVDERRLIRERRATIARPSWREARGYSSVG